MPTAQSDRSLADQVRRTGDEAAFRDLYRRHTPAVYQFVLRLTAGDEFRAEDVVQETWIRAVEGLDGFEWRSGLRTWLNAIALNVCRGMFRRKDNQWLELREDGLGPADPIDPVGHIDLEQALSRLPPGQRVIVILHDLEGHTHEEIAERLAIAPGTSKSQLSRARRTLRSWLDDDDAGQR